MPDQERWPLTIIRRGGRVGSDHPEYVWWQELPEGQSAESLRSVGYETVQVVPAFWLCQSREQERQRVEEALIGEDAMLAWCGRNLLVSRETLKGIFATLASEADRQ